MTPRQALKLLDPARLQRIKHGISNTYNSVGGDVWGERAPSNAIFVDIMCDQLRNFAVGGEFSSCTDEDIDIFWSLSARKRKEICLEVGP